MSKPISLFSALLCTFIWGTTFIAQDTGMDNIGPFTFNAVRFFVGFLAITPLVILFELKNFKSELKTDKKTFIIYVSLIGLSLFLGSALQQVALLFTDVANAAFFTIFYVPMVPIIIYLFGKKSIHWSVWPSVVLCLIGGYLLTNFYDATVRLGDTLVVLGALFWSTHIIFTGIIISKYNLPLTIGATQTLMVAFLSFLIGILYEEFVWSNILMEIYSILYAGILSGGFAFVLQIYAQKNITPAPAAIIFSLEGVFATVAAWFILNQVLDINNILGCFFILCGVLLSQLLPLTKRKQFNKFSTARIGSKIIELTTGYGEKLSNIVFTVIGIIIACMFLYGIEGISYGDKIVGFFSDDFSPLNTLGNLFYFSVVVYSTVGFGEMLPIGPIGKSVMIFEGIMGGLVGFTLGLLFTYNIIKQILKKFVSYDRIFLLVLFGFQLLVENLNLISILGSYVVLWVYISVNIDNNEYRVNHSQLQ